MIRGNAGRSSLSRSPEDNRPVRTIPTAVALVATLAAVDAQGGRTFDRKTMLANFAEMQTHSWFTGGACAAKSLRNPIPNAARSAHDQDGLALEVHKIHAFDPLELGLVFLGKHIAADDHLHNL